MSRFALAAAGVAVAHAASGQRGGNSPASIRGWSVRRQVLGHYVFNDAGERIGKIEDLILTKKVVTHAVVGIGGFLGVGTYEVAVPVAAFTRKDDRIVLPASTRETLLGMPRLEW